MPLAWQSCSGSAFPPGLLERGYMVRYQITASEGCRRYINARAFYTADSEDAALACFERDFPEWANPPENEDRYVKCEPDPREAERDFLGYCTKCGQPAVWRFNYTDANGSDLCLRLCAKCNRPKNHRPIVNQALAVAGCKKHARAWWL